MLDLSKLIATPLQEQPFRWGEIGNLFSAADAAALARTYPRDHFKTVVGYGGEKDYEYEARALIGMGARTASYAEELSDAWQRLARDLLSSGYREAMSTLTGLDLMQSPLEVNIFHFGPGASLGPHPDLADKVVTHVLYFNETWESARGGCLQILASNDPDSIVAEVQPVVGNSAVLVRSATSWHAVSRVVDGCKSSRRSMTVTFYRPGSRSSMWPEGDTTPLHRYDVAD